MSLDHAIALVHDTAKADLNEADTRFQIIDRLLEQVLGWPRAAFRMEKSTVEGYADYLLTRPNGSAALVIEAKRTGVHFSLPDNYNSGKQFRNVKVSALLTGGAREALIQAQRYSADIGCEYAAVSNGRQFIFFKAFERGKSWKDLGALVVSDIAWFRDSYADAVGFLGYSSVIERGSLNSAFKGLVLESRETYYPKEKINAYSQILNQNFMAPTLRPLAKNYFGPLTDHDPDFIEHCYVNERAYDLSLSGVRTLIKDSVTPFFETYGVVETGDTSKGGAISARIQKSVKDRRGSDVVVLFGGKGSGKSTFLWRVLHHEPPQYIRKHVAVATVNLLHVSKDETSIRDAIWNGVIAKLDTEKLLDGDRDGLLKLFEDRWSVASKQELFGLEVGSQAFHQAANAKVTEWKADAKYVAGRLARWHQRMHRGCVVVLDNTDQLDNDLQDYSFTIAQEVSRELNCLVLISMREERFYASKIRGLLDAYQNNAFHISSPSSSEVFIRRLEYLIGLLRSGRLDVGDDNRDQLIAFLLVFLADFKRAPDSSLNRFISACAHGNIRLALDLFVDLLLSGYTNAREMIEGGRGWTIQVHQVLRPLMSPTRLFYDEKLSKIINLFQIRVGVGGSHFTGLRILRLLSVGQDPTSPGFVPFGVLKNQFVSNYGGEEDFKAWIDSLLAANLIEASTRQDSYSENIDSLRVTAFGQFAQRELITFFTYIELVSTDCGVRQESVANQLAALTNEEVALLNQRKKYERVQRRLQKAKAFLDYLEGEEIRELEYFGTPDADRFVDVIQRAFAKEREEVTKSAKRNRRRQAN